MKISAVQSVFTVFLLAATFYSTLFAEELQRFEYKKIQMGVPVRLVFYGESQTEQQKARADAAAEKVFSRIETLKMVFSDYESESELRKACVEAQSGKEVRVSEDFWIVLKASEKYYRLSQGAFDPTVAGAVKLWRRAMREGRFPRKDKLEEARRLTNFALVELNEQNRSMRFAEKGMRLDFGGIAKGYIIDESLKILCQEGFPRAMVDIGGDLALGDAPPPESGKPEGWKIGLMDASGEKVKEFKYLSRCAVATSGATNRYVEIDGVRYSHIINPKTGIGLTHSSVTTVIAPTAMEADAWASARSVNPQLPEFVNQEK